MIKFKELKEAYGKYEKYYKRLILDNISSDWDIVIVTAGNEIQAGFYRDEIEYRVTHKLIPISKYIVLSDDGNYGSGSSTINVLKYLNDNEPNWLSKKILLIHSGGDSKRLPQYSIEGKVFIGFPKGLDTKKSVTIFDEIMITLCQVPNNLLSGIFVACGDTILLLDADKINCNKKDAIAFSTKASVKVGTKHGVFATNKHNILTYTHQKKDQIFLETNSLVDSNGEVDLDSGAFWFSSNLLLKLLKFSESAVSCNSPYLNLYTDIIFPFATDGSLTDYLQLPCDKNEDKNDLISVRRLLWETLHKYSVYVVKDDCSCFMHFGDSVELLAMLSKDSIANKLLRFDRANPILLFTNNSLINNSVISAPVIPHCSIIMNSKIDLELPDNILLYSSILLFNGKKRYVTFFCSIYDNPKDNNFFGEKLGNLIKTKDDILWGNDYIKNLWNADLYRLCNSLEESVKSILFLIKLSKHQVTSKDMNSWIKSDRISMASIKKYYDVKGNHELVCKMQVQLIANSIINRFFGGEDIRKIMQYVPKELLTELIDNISRSCKEDYKKYALLSYLASCCNLSSRYHRYQKKCYQLIKESILVENNNLLVSNPCQEVIVKKPARINFCGGWTDTPPYCLENGGSVTNAAVKIDGNYPIKVTVSRYIKGKFRLESIDYNINTVFDSIEALQKISKNDNFRLVKSVLIVLGILENNNFSEYGIEIITDVSLPTGTGLGTSSILIAALIEGICKFYSIDISMNDIFNYTMKVEQYMGVGGGWQDQIGGMTVGIKCITTDTGYCQKYDIVPIYFDVDSFNDRLIILYTSTKHVARNIVRDVTSRYLFNYEESKKSLEEIKHLSNISRIALEKNDIDEFAKILLDNFHTTLKLSNNIEFDVMKEIVNYLKPLLSGYSVAGAGGGGFMILILRQEVKKNEFIEYFNLKYKNTNTKIYDFSFCMSECGSIYVKK